MYFAIPAFGVHTLIAVINGVEKTAKVFRANHRIESTTKHGCPICIENDEVPVFSAKIKEAWIGRNKGFGEGPFWNAPWGIPFSNGTWSKRSESHGSEEVGHSILLRLSQRNQKQQPYIISYVLIASGSVQEFSLPRDDPVIDFQSTIEDSNTVCPFAVTKSKDVLLFSDEVRFPLCVMGFVGPELAGASPAEAHLQCDFPTVSFPCKCLYATEYTTEDAHADANDAM